MKRDPLSHSSFKLVPTEYDEYSFTIYCTCFPSSPTSSVCDSELCVPLRSGRHRRSGSFLPQGPVCQHRPGLSSGGEGSEGSKPVAGETVDKVGSERTPLYLHCKTGYTLSSPEPVGTCGFLYLNRAYLHNMTYS